MSRTQGHVYVVVPEAEHVDQPDMQNTFYTYNYFFASCSFINASCVIDLGLEVEAFRKAII